MGWLNGNDTTDSNLQARVRDLELLVAELQQQLAQLRRETSPDWQQPPQYLGRPPVPEQTAGYPEAAAYPSATQPTWDTHARALAASGQKIVAIKEVREATGWGLKEAKDYVDRF